MRRRSGPLCDDATIKFGPLHGVIVRAHVGPAFVTRGMKRCLPIPQDPFQDRETEAPRTRVDQDIGVVPFQSGLRGRLRRKDFLDCLDFAEMVAAADAAE
jgi:hypothetical protein